MQLLESLVLSKETGQRDCYYRNHTLFHHTLFRFYLSHLSVVYLYCFSRGGGIHTHESHTRKHIHESHTSSVVYWQGSHTRRLVLRTQRESVDSIQVLYKSYTDTHSQAPNTRKYRHTHAHQTHANTDTHEEVWHVRFFSGVCWFVRQIARGSIP